MKAQQYYLCSEFRGRLYRIDAIRFHEAYRDFTCGPYGAAQAEFHRQWLQHWCDDRGLDITIHIGAWEAK